METKKRNQAIRVILILILFFTTYNVVIGQYQTTCRINNITLLNANQFSFKIYLKNISGSSLEYATGQYYINFNTLILNSGTGSLTILSSDLPITIRPRNPVVSGSEIQLRTNSVPGAGFGYILNNNDSIVVAEVRFTTSASAFTSNSTSNLAWKLTGPGFITKFSAYIGTTNTQIESQSTFGVDNNNTPLPVEMISFTGIVKGRNITLIFSTAKEINNKGFEILRKSSNTEWNKIGYLDGKGNSDVKVEYTYNDNKLNTEKYNYKLKQIDYNGNFTFFSLNSQLEIGLPTKFELYQNYPNPFNPSTKIDFDIPRDANTSITVYDLTGREIKVILNNVLKTAGYYSVDFTDNNLASGIYFYRIIAISGKDKFISTKRMVVIK